VNSQQPVDETTKAMNNVGHHYDEEHKPFIFLLLECKRRNKKAQGIADMEGQLYSYMQFFFEPSGLANGRREVYGAVAYGTKIRAWQFRYDGTYVTSYRMWGDNDYPADEASYRDPGIPEEATEIESFFWQAKESSSSRKMNLPIPSPAHGVPFRNMAPALQGNSSMPYTYSMTPQSDQLRQGEGDAAGGYHLMNLQPGSNTNMRQSRQSEGGDMICQGDESSAGSSEYEGGDAPGGSESRGDDSGAGDLGYSDKGKGRAEPGDSGAYEFDVGPRNTTSNFEWVGVSIYKRVAHKDDYVFTPTYGKHGKPGKPVYTKLADWKKGKFEGHTVDILTRKGKTYVSNHRLS
jgi:hypothetical protein